MSATDTPLTDFEVMSAWEADYTLFSHATLLAESIAQDTLHITPPAALPNDRSKIPPETLLCRSELLQSLRTIQKKIRTTLQLRITDMTSKPRLYRLATRLSLSDEEVRAFVFIILTCTGMDGPPADERRQTPRPRSELFTCRQFANMHGHQLLHFLSPGRVHFAQGLLEVDEEFAAMYTENRFRAPREVLKAIYGCTLTLDEAMTLGNSALADVLAEEPGSIQADHADHASALGLAAARSPSLSPLADSVDDPPSASADELTPNHLSARECTTDNSAVLELLSELRSETSPDEQQSKTSKDSDNPATDDEVTANGHNTPDTDINNIISPYADDMDYLKDGFEVVQEACKVYNFREKNSDEDRYTNTKRPVEALQREADAKLRKASALFLKRLNKSKTHTSFTPRLEMLVEKLKLDHFERMVILTLGTFFLHLCIHTHAGAHSLSLDSLLLLCLAFYARPARVSSHRTLFCDVS